MEHVDGLCFIDRDYRLSPNRNASVHVKSNIAVGDKFADNTHRDVVCIKIR